MELCVAKNSQERFVRTPCHILSQSNLKLSESEPTDWSKMEQRILISVRVDFNHLWGHPHVIPSPIQFRFTSQLSFFCPYTNQNHITTINLLDAELNPIWNLLTLLGAHPILHVSRIRVKSSPDCTTTLTLINVVICVTLRLSLSHTSFLTEVWFQLDMSLWNIISLGYTKLHEY